MSMLAPGLKVICGGNVLFGLHFQITVVHHQGTPLRYELKQNLLRKAPSDLLLIELALLAFLYN